MTMQLTSGPSMLRFRHPGRSVPGWRQSRMGWSDATGHEVRHAAAIVLEVQEGSR